jgi:hypothetical protein
MLVCGREYGELAVEWRMRETYGALCWELSRVGDVV